MSSADISDHNTRAVLAALRENGALTRRALAGALGLTETAIASIVRRMVESHFLKQHSPAGGGQGATFSIIEDAGIGIGVYLYKKKARIAVVSLAGAVVDEREFGSCGDVLEWIDDIVEAPSPRRIPDIAVASDPASADLLVALLQQRDGQKCKMFQVRDTEAALSSLRLTPGVNTDIGMGVILIDETVRAGTMFSDRFFYGARGCAGQIGAMRPAPDAPTLNETAGLLSFNAHIAAGRPEDEWVEHAASRLLDAIVAISAFVSPGEFWIGGSLPEPVLDTIVERVVAGKALKAGHFIATRWIPAVNRLEDTGTAIARGAAMVTLKQAFLPLPASDG
ncbi:winged helix-turn-helix domain-containing protein [uncultured Martelella sp.]|uniref:winged helix-turn-helix domain-containing protein n=1 Tax=uncultured Martelella sp. TaxID=392331 RepID=UPI0029C73BEB|nr:winged helix-turn-helix domain-containing protein [uncultured Martelella sp.]